MKNFHFLKYKWIRGLEIFCYSDPHIQLLKIIFLYAFFKKNVLKIHSKRSFCYHGNPFPEVKPRMTSHCITSVGHENW